MKAFFLTIAFFCSSVFCGVPFDDYLALSVQEMHGNPLLLTSAKKLEEGRRALMEACELMERDANFTNSPVGKQLAELLFLRGRLSEGSGFVRANRISYAFKHLADMIRCDSAESTPPEVLSVARGVVDSLAWFCGNPVPRGRIISVVVLLELELIILIGLVFLQMKHDYAGLAWHHGL